MRFRLLYWTQLMLTLHIELYNPQSNIQTKHETQMIIEILKLIIVDEQNCQVDWR